MRRGLKSATHELAEREKAGRKEEKKKDLNEIPGTKQTKKNLKSGDFQRGLEFFASRLDGQYPGGGASPPVSSSVRRMRKLTYTAGGVESLLKIDKMLN